MYPRSPPPGVLSPLPKQAVTSLTSDRPSIWQGGGGHMLSHGVSGLLGPGGPTLRGLRSWGGSSFTQSYPCALIVAKQACRGCWLSVESSHPAHPGLHRHAGPWLSCLGSDCLLLGLRWPCASLGHQWAGGDPPVPGSPQLGWGLGRVLQGKVAHVDCHVRRLPVSGLLPAQRGLPPRSTVSDGVFWKQAWSLEQMCVRDPCCQGRRRQVGWGRWL